MGINSYKIGITIDPGHSINYNRGVNGTYYESNVMYDLAQYLKKYLLQYGVFDVHLTKSELSQNPSLTSRGNLAITTKSRLFLSLHTNAASAASANYTVVFGSIKLKNSEEFSKALSSVIATCFREYGETTVQPSTTWSRVGSGGNDYYGVTNSSVASPSVEHSALLEHSFHSNWGAVALLSDPNFIEQLAIREAKFIYDYYIKSDTFISESASYQNATVNTQGLNVRVKPDTSTGQIIGTLNSGDSVRVFSVDNGWAKILYYGGAAYISTSYITIDDSVIIPDVEDTTPDDTEDTSVEYIVSDHYQTGTINYPNLPVRTSPYYDDNQITTLTLGTKVKVYVSFEVVGDSSFSNYDTWLAIDYNGTPAFVSRSYITLDDDVFKLAITIADLNYRAAPGVDSSGNYFARVGTLLKGTTVYAKPSSVKDWSEIKLDKNRMDSYFVASNYLSVTETDAPTIDDDNINYYIASYGKIIYSNNYKSLPVYAGPGTQYSKIDTIANGYYVIVDGETNGWTKILYKNKISYVNSNYIDILISEGTTYEYTKPEIPTVAEELDINEWFKLTSGAVVETPYGNDPNTELTDGTMFYPGIRYKTWTGAIIYTPIDGMCVFSGYSLDYGNLCIILAQDNTKHYFAHLKFTPAMNAGEFYTSSSVVGISGTHGKYIDSGLYYEIRNVIPQAEYFQMNPTDYVIPHTINRNVE